MILSEELALRFFQKIKVGADSECWPWRAAVLEGMGYGVIRIKGKNHIAHRVAWSTTYGKIPTGMLVCHTCDNAVCCNPKHLFLGTPKDNMQDMIRKGRARWTGTPKVTDKQVVQARRAWVKKPTTQTAAAFEKLWAAKFKVTAKTVQALVRGYYRTALGAV